ncbi:hypothetical protein GXB81_01410 [Paraburkholderia sp. Ac-20336]|uniref:hypothetical protein n=1 Tax=Paraburkholderia sp. Ac-20336 TaxID=2703886 RepID=UPI00197DA962|nr:hypothetical protein [Paraburkholderia sp. Ac-20336]MBN3801719.1 hypothetical protein [Paraburkholderia sp. Ac-20336]
MKKTLVCIGVCAVLSACGGGSGGSGSTGNSTSNGSSGGNGSSQSGGGSQAAQAQPLAAQQTYIGTVSFGDTISVQIDAPAKGQITTTFINSQFGLAGKLVGNYTLTTGNYVVTSFAASGTVPAALAAGANAVGMQFAVTADSGNHGVLSGQLSNVPNVAAGSGSQTLSGQIAASNNGVTTVAGLAGTYSFIKLSGDYTAAGVPVGSQDADTGQMQINADGTFRACPSAAYSANCMDDSDASIADTGSITVDPDQATYPGAFDMTLNGKSFGRLFASTSGGNLTLMLDQAGTNSEGTFRTGSWVFQTAQALASGTYDGTWLCSEPNTSDNNQLLGNIVTNRVTIAGTTLTPSGQYASPFTLNFNATFNAASSSSTPTLTNGVNGLMAGLLRTTSNGSTVQSAMMFLPVSSTNLYYLDEVNGNGFFVEGLCVRQ